MGALTGANPGGLTGNITCYAGCTVAPEFQDCKWLNTMTTRLVGYDGVSVQPAVSGCGALTAKQLKQESSFRGFDFETVWFFDPSDGYEYPKLMERPESGIVQGAFSWEWLPAAGVLRITPLEDPEARYAVVAQYAQGRFLSVGLVDLEDGEQFLYLHDPETVRTALFLLTDAFAPVV